MMILVPKSREIEIPIRRGGMRGWYKIEAGDRFGPRRVLADWFPNLITTLGRDLFGSKKNGQGFGAGCATGCFVGTGNTAPAVTDTALQTLLASTTTVHAQSNPGNSSSAPYYGANLIQYQFAQGAAAGNLSEVGVGTASNSLFSRALILDGGGSPTTITVLSNEYLYVSYQLNLYNPTADVTGNVTIGGVVYAYVLRAETAGAGDWNAVNLTNDGGQLFGGRAFNGAIGTILGSPTGSNSDADTITPGTYSAGSYQQTGSLQWGLSAGNLSGGITVVDMRFIGVANYQLSFSPAIPKDSSHILVLNVGHTWLNNSP